MFRTVSIVVWCLIVVIDLSYAAPGCVLSLSILEALNSLFRSIFKSILPRLAQEFRSLQHIKTGLYPTVSEIRLWVIMMMMVLSILL